MKKTTANLDFQYMNTKIIFIIFVTFIGLEYDII